MHTLMFQIKDTVQKMVRVLSISKFLKTESWIPIRFMLRPYFSDSSTAMDPLLRRVVYSCQ